MIDMPQPPSPLYTPTPNTPFQSIQHTLSTINTPVQSIRQQSFIPTTRNIHSHSYSYMHTIITTFVIISSGGGVIGAPGRNASRSILNDLNK